MANPLTASDITVGAKLTFTKLKGGKEKCIVTGKMDKATKKVPVSYGGDDCDEKTANISLDRLGRRQGRQPVSPEAKAEKAKAAAKGSVKANLKAGTAASKAGTKKAKDFDPASVNISDLKQEILDAKEFMTDHYDRLLAVLETFNDDDAEGEEEESEEEEGEEEEGEEESEEEEAEESPAPKKGRGKPMGRRK